MQRKKTSSSLWPQLPPAGSTEYKAPLVLVMGMFFLIAGSWILLTIPYRFYQKSKLDQGVIVPAKILEVQSHRRSLSVRYEFLWENRVIQGNRASLHWGSDGLYHRLRNAQEQGLQVPCYVDPHHPEWNTLEKEIHVLHVIVMLIMGTPFALIGSIYLIRFIGSHRSHPKNRSYTKTSRGWRRT